MSDSINLSLTKLSIAIRIANEKIMCEIGLHAGQAQILMSLWEKDPQSQAELVKNLCIAAPTVNKMVKKLVESDFVVPEKCSNDKRLVKVKLTTKGEKIKQDVKSQQKKLEKIIYKGFSETERLSLPILLEKVYVNLSNQPYNS